MSPIHGLKGILGTAGRRQQAIGNSKREEEGRRKRAELGGVMWERRRLWGEEEFFGCFSIFLA
jgi:hypothetical protein